MQNIKIEANKTTGMYKTPQAMTAPFEEPCIDINDPMLVTNE